MNQNLKRIGILQSLLCLICSCSFGPKAVPDEVEYAIQLSGNNQKELWKVINHFQKAGEDEKLKAAFFLLENMIDQYHFEGAGVEQNRERFNRMDSLLKSGNGIFNRSWDSIQAIYPPPPLSSVKVIDDLSVVKAEYLIQHIDGAFKAWSYPWARHLTFDEFCEYILPYKLMNEEPESWMRICQHKYQWVLDSVPKNRDAKDVCLLINKDLKNEFYVNARFSSNWDVSYSDLQKTHTGKCSHATQMATYSMRAMGVPIAMDFTPHWANKNLSHEWNALLLDGKTYHFVGSESDPGKDKVSFTRSYWLRRKRAKVFRRTYAIQSGSLACLENDFRKIPGEFRNRHIKDVTQEYVPVSDVKLQVNRKVPNARFVYLCVFNDQTWHPIYWGAVNSSGEVIFENMGRDIAYLPVYYEFGALIPAANPFILSKTGLVEPIPTSSKVLQKVTIKQKYPEDKSNKITEGETYELFYWSNKWLSLGTQTAISDSLIYKNVPSNALLMVKNIHKGKQERIFRFREGTQEWW